jgi:hypothetical protein
VSYPKMRVVRRTLSGSPTGAGIKISSTSSGVEIHTHDSTFNQSQFDEVHLWAYNSHSAAVTVTLQWGGTTDPDNLLPIALNSGSFLQIVCGIPISGNLSVNAVAGTANKIIVYGYVMAHMQADMLEGQELLNGSVAHREGYTQR